MATDEKSAQLPYGVPHFPHNAPGINVDLSQIPKEDNSSAQLSDGQIESTIQVSFKAEAISGGSLPPDQPLEKPRKSASMAKVPLYSDTVLPTSCLVENSDTKEACELIGIRCPSVRKCSTNDGSNLYLAFSVAFVEHLTRRLTSAAEVAKVRDCLSEVDNYPSVREILDQVDELKRQNLHGIEWMKYQRRNVVFWTEIQKIFQTYVKVALTKIRDTASIFNGMTQKQAQSSLINLDNADIPLTLLASIFNLKIIVFSTNFHQLKTTYTMQNEIANLAYIYLFREKNTYHVLYSQAQLEKEMHSLLLSQSDFYFCPGSDIIAKIKDTQRMTLANIGFCEWTSRYMELLLNLIDQQTLFSLIDNELTKETPIIRNDILIASKAFSQFSAEIISPFIRKAKEDVECIRKRLFAIFTRLRGVNMCELCHNLKACMKFECGDSFCEECIQAYFAEIRNRGKFLLNFSCQTAIDTVCPKKTCSLYISTSKFKEILGEDFFSRQISIISDFCFSKLCVKCMKIVPNHRFLAFCECNIGYCQLCYYKFVHQNGGRCECGKTLSIEAYKRILSQEFTCEACCLTKSLLKDFTSVECEKHSICEECLSRASQQDYRCPNCYRIFTHQEVSELQYLRVYKPCLFCREDCRKSRLNTLCGCVICEKCATSAAQMSNKYLNCFNCRAMLPEFGTNQLKLWTEPVAEEEMKDCPICYIKIERGQESTLPCGNAFHSTCLSDFYENMIVKDSYAEGEVYCPNSMCKVMTPANDIRNFVSAEVFQKYHENFIKEHTTPCPRCQNRIPDKDDSGGKKMNILCPNCRFCFCVACKGEYDPRHDDKRCRFNKIQKLVRETEQQVEIVGGIVGQCPLCRYPSIRGEGSDNIECSNASCKTEFCVQCSVSRYLYSIHGEAWHRPACVNYKARDRKEGMSENCRACMSKKKLCDQPPDLKVKGRFDIDE